jgi:hypothetical protein
MSEPTYLQHHLNQRLTARKCESPTLQRHVVSCFRISANSATVPADCNAVLIYEFAVVQMTVTSQHNALPLCRGIKVLPSGRLLSRRESPFGSFVTGIPAVKMLYSDMFIVIVIIYKFIYLMFYFIFCIDHYYCYYYYQYK